MDSELIPLESGETCIAAIMTAQSENSNLIIAAQKIDKDISIVREWLLAGKFPTCVQEFAPASYELKHIGLAEGAYTWIQRTFCGAIVPPQGRARS